MVTHPAYKVFLAGQLWPHPKRAGPHHPKKPYTCLQS